MPDPRVDEILKMLGGYSGLQRIEQWNNGDNLPLLDCLGQQPGQLANITMEWEAVKQQTYALNDVLLQWRTALAGQGIVLP